MYAVILAGGSGTRFWPLSRETMPKQLLKIGGENTLICETVGRILSLVRGEDIFIVTNGSLLDSINYQLSSKYNRSWVENCILEPEARNTAPALGLAALHLERMDPEAVMAVLAADHIIRKTEDFLNLLRRAERVAKADYLVTLGIKPHRPETGYGYIKVGERCDSSWPIADSSSHDGSVLMADGGVYRVEAFVEKPNIETANEYIKNGSYYWNSGMFVWKVKNLLSEIKKYEPALYEGLAEIRKNIGTPNEDEVIRRVFQKLKSISIDYAVMEKTDRAVVIPADVDWSDVGSWTALDDITNKDASGNIISGNVIDIGSRDSIIYAEKRLVATIGLTNVVVVDTPDATLVSTKERAQDVKKVVEELKKRKAEEHLTHRTVLRPWGSYTVLESGERYKIKRIVINPGAKLSHQLHHHRSEHWVVVAGTARVINGDKSYDVHPNESTYIPMSTKHRLENVGKVPLQIIEVQNGEYLEEDDIVRFDDEYSRHQCKNNNVLPPITRHEKK